MYSSTDLELILNTVTGSTRPEFYLKFILGFNSPVLLQNYLRFCEQSDILIDVHEILEPETQMDYQTAFCYATEADFHELLPVLFEYSLKHSLLQKVFDKTALNFGDAVKSLEAFKILRQYEIPYHFIAESPFIQKSNRIVDIESNILSGLFLDAARMDSTQVDVMIASIINKDESLFGDLVNSMTEEDDCWASNLIKNLEAAGKLLDIFNNENIPEAKRLEIYTCIHTPTVKHALLSKMITTMHDLEKFIDPATVKHSSKTLSRI